MKTTPQTFLKFIAGTAIAAAVLFLIWYFSSIVVYILVSAVLAVMGRPLVNRLAALHVRGWRVPRWLAALVTLVVIWALFALCCSLFVPLVFNKINQFSTVDFASVVNSIGEPIARMQRDLQNLFALSESSFSLSDELTAMFRQVVDMESVNWLFSSVVGVVVSSVIALFSISFITRTTDSSIRWSRPSSRSVTTTTSRGRSIRSRCCCRATLRVSSPRA